MRFRVDVNQTTKGWEVQVTDERGQPIPGSPRSLESIGADAVLFPRLPPEETAALAARPACGRPEHCGLCTGDSPQFLEETLAALLAGDTQEGRVVRFGRYLFNALLGDEVWQSIKAPLAQHHVELALTWRSAEAAISRLPWEMMHSGAGFLAMEPRLALTRRIAGATATVGTLTSPPRVLFVVGTTANDQDIGPGAEYLGLLRGLRWSQAGLTLKPHLLLEATENTLKAAINWFQPTVIHFVCHGGFDLDGEPYLEFRRDQEPGDQSGPKKAELRASQLAAWLAGAKVRPEIVVVNACHSASAKAGQIASPFAVELVRCGTPVVVGMAGQVADHACRLFTRCFYEALLLGKGIAEAAADGRRAGIIGKALTDPAKSVDWAMPTLFLAEATGEPRLDPSALAAERAREAAAAGYPCDSYPPFCGRLETLQWYDKLMADKGAQQSIWGRKDGLQVLAITSQGNTQRFGRKRLLQEWARRAARDGHVPCLVTKEKIRGNDPPKDFRELRTALIEAVNDACKALGLQDQWHMSTSLVQKLEETTPGAPLSEDLPVGIRDEYVAVKDPLHPRVWAVAFRLDLLGLLEAARRNRPEPPGGARLVLLIHDVHLMGDAARDLLEDLLGPAGLREEKAQEGVRVVFTYAPDPPGTPDPRASTLIEPWLGQWQLWAERVTLGPFQQPVEEELAYRHFLLHYREDPDTETERPLAIVPATGRQKFVMKLMRHKVQGVPGNLLAGGSDAVRNLLLEEDYPALRDANDEDALRLIYGGEEARR